MVGVLVAGIFVLAACDTADTAATEPSAVEMEPVPTDTESAPSAQRFRYPEAPPSPGATDDSNTEAAELIDRVNEQLLVQSFDFLAVSELAQAGDPRHAWYLADLMRFFGGDEGTQVRNAFEEITGVRLAADLDSLRSPWLSATNHLIAWDTPAYPGYELDKAGIFLLLEPRWNPFFEDDSDIDWRHVSWGGVLIDDRELGDPDPCARGCIPALDDPAVTDAEGGDWYADDRTVFGIEVGGETLAIPLNIAEVHEMFNLTLGGRRLGIPYCTLCGSAQAYFTDSSGAAEDPVLRTSGLLSRSNKVMYDVRTESVFDTFTGDAVSGPLREQGVSLEETTVVRSTWGDWKQQHPDTKIVARDGGIGRSYELDPLGGRDDDGPIFPIGQPDDRLPEQESVVGVIAPDGTPVAFPADLADTAVELEREVELGGVRLVASGDGLTAETLDGEPVAAHEAFWFAWSQFHPDTLLWPE